MARAHLETTLSLDDAEIRVEGTTDPGEPQSWEHPGDPPSAEIHHVWLKRQQGIEMAQLHRQPMEIDILPYLDFDTTEALEQELLEKAGEDDEAAYDDEMERRMDQAREEG